MVVTRVIVALAIFAALGCGKYGRPVPPEALSPAEVRDLAVAAQLGGVALSWRAPNQDLRSKELTSIEGYKIRRASTGGDEPATVIDVGFVEDTHLAVQAELRAAAEAEGRASRRIKADPALSKFSFVDTTVESGRVYTYSIVPVNQGGTEGRVREALRVAFKGESSVVTRVPASGLAEAFAVQPPERDEEL